MTCGWFGLIILFHVGIMDQKLLNGARSIVHWWSLIGEASVYRLVVELVYEKWIVEIFKALLRGFGGLPNISSILEASAMKGSNCLRLVSHTRTLRSWKHSLSLVRCLWRILQHILNIGRHVKEVLHNGCLSGISILRQNLVHANEEVLRLLQSWMVWEELAALAGWRSCSGKEWADWNAVTVGLSVAVVWHALHVGVVV